MERAAASPTAGRSRWCTLRTRLALLGVIALATLPLAACSDDGTSAETTTAAVTTTGAIERAPLAASVARVRRELRGVPQRGLVLGNPKAPVTIIEYADFECPACVAAHTAVLPDVIKRYVRTGQADLEFRGLATAEPSTERDLALGAHGAAAQDEGWDFVQLAFLRTLERVAGGPVVPDETPTQLAGALGLDVPAFERDSSGPAAAAEVAAATNVAAIGRFSTYPVFLVRARNRPEHPFVVVTGASSVRELGAAIKKARAAGG